MLQKYDYFYERIKTSSHLNKCQYNRKHLIELQIKCGFRISKPTLKIILHKIRFNKMLQRFEAILLFYRPYVLWSFAINILIIVFSPHIFPAIITKFFLTLFIWYLVNETNARKRLIFFKNLGISSFRLFASLFLIDIIITISFLLIMQEFI